MTDPKRILVVEDDTDIREYLSKLLPDFGFQVDSASDGRRALKALAEIRPGPALVLLDINLPRGLSGIEVCRQVMASGGADKPRIVMMTAMGDKETIMTAIEAGAVDYLVKPFKVPVLMEKLRKHAGVAPVTPTSAGVPAEREGADDEVGDEPFKPVRTFRGSGLASRLVAADDRGDAERPDGANP